MSADKPIYDENTNKCIPITCCKNNTENKNRDNKIDKCLKAKNKNDCENNDGKWGQFGLATIEQCICPTKDANCPCKSSDDCSGFKTNSLELNENVDSDVVGMCTPESPYFGCFGTLEINNNKRSNVGLVCRLKL